MDKLRFLPQTTSSGNQGNEEVLARLKDAIQSGDGKGFLEALRKLPTRRTAPHDEWELLRLATELNRPGIVQVLLQAGWCNTKEQLRELDNFTFARIRYPNYDPAFDGLHKLIGSYNWHPLLGAVHKLDETGHPTSKLEQARWAAQEAEDIDFYLGVGGKLEDWLRLVCISGDVEMATRLLQKLQQQQLQWPRMENTRWRDAEDAAIKHGQLAALKLLLEHGGYDAKHLSFLLQKACEHQQVEIIHWLIAQGADVNYTCSSSIGSYCLQGSARKGRSEVVRILLQHGAKAAPFYWRCLMWDACLSGSSATLKALLTEGPGCTDMLSWRILRQDAEKCASRLSAEVLEVLAAFKWDESAGRVVKVV